MINLTFRFEILERHYKCVSNVCKLCEMPGVLTCRESDITLHYIRSKQLYTPSICLHKHCEIGKSRFKIPR